MRQPWRSWKRSPTQFHNGRRPPMDVVKRMASHCDPGSAPRLSTPRFIVIPSRSQVGIKTSRHLVPRCFQWNRSTADEDLFFHPARLTGVWTYWPPSSPGGRFENSPAVDCRVRMSDCISPAGTAESPNVLRQLLLSVHDKGSPENSSTVPSGL